ncbi:HCL362Wp [Eremothecium sinecaudum]|uniref:HCL362Wp n=1 Tax=Eremothecium sinecaudum TaxID=45286 RepID=A0A120K1V7_9SACH|nr:HCL362Wp [Eremothecium sinecaudum]AMD19789.1 HCL362Wp [Eremothecium sinecaudum]
MSIVNKSSTKSYELEFYNDIASDEYKSKSALLDDIEAGEQSETIDDGAVEKPKRRIYGWSLLIQGILSLIIVFLLVKQYGHGKPSAKVLNKIPGQFDLDAILQGEFGSGNKQFRFLYPPISHLMNKGSDEGTYLVVETIGSADTFIAKKLADPEFKKILGRANFTHNGVNYTAGKIEPTYKLDRLIYGAELQQIYRYSSEGHYWMKDIESGQFEPICPERDGKLANLSYVHFSPSFSHIYFVHENDLYIQDVSGDGTVKRVTSDGSSEVFNGKPDWVYEEEIFASDSAVWWAPDDSSFVYLKINDTNVKSYIYPKYINGEEYPTDQSVKYPKPGEAVPSITLYHYDVAEGKSSVIDLKMEGEHILYLVQWINSNHLLLKVTDRYSRVLNVKVYDATSKELKNTRTEFAEDYSGWIEKLNDIVPIPPNPERGRDSYGYVDLGVDSSGDMNIYYYRDPYEEKGLQLTSGAWEVTSENWAFDYDKNVIYFHANVRHTMAQHLYSVAIEDGHLECMQEKLSDLDYTEFLFSSSARYALMYYKGPNIPLEMAAPLLDLLLLPDKNNNATMVSDNENLVEALQYYKFPDMNYKSMSTDDGVNISYVETLPATLKSNRKYPLLVKVYGGPGSRVVTTSFGVDFQTAVASGLDAIVLQLEPRGTAGRGWSYRRWSTDNIGYWECRDITEITRKYIESHSDLIDTERVAIWGWSYGGFNTLKTLEYDNGETFKYGIAVAPVTDWKLYDSFYTERYLGSIAKNKDAYATASITDVQPFANVKRFMLAHGTADDNVHIQNTYNFIDLLNLAEIRNFDMHIFPDSNHEIQFHNGIPVIYKSIYFWLQNAFTGQFDNLAS